MSSFSVEQLADATGLSEAALRLFLCILAGYPLALIYRVMVLLCRNPKALPAQLLQHLFSIVGGLSFTFFCYGNDVLHSLIAVSVTYLLLWGCPSRMLGTALSFIFNFCYLLIGYYFMATDEYHIDWTMPHCVLTLRLIGKLDLQRQRATTHVSRVLSLVACTSY